MADGDGNGSAIPDIGAFEYQRRAPTAVAGASPGAVAPGDAVTFSGLGSADPDPGDSITYSWSFDDGTTATGQTAVKSFAGEGTHSGTLTVTDPTGRTATATASVVVASPPTGPDTSGPGDSSGAGGSGPSDTDPPETTIKRAKVDGDDVKVVFTADERGSTFRCHLDRKRFKPCTSPKRLKDLDDGKHKFFVQATDASGNTDPTPARAKFEIAA